MSKKALSIVLIILLIFSLSNIALADYNPPDSINADPVFNSITITLTTYKYGLFSAYTNNIVGSIKVASCWLQKKLATVGLITVHFQLHQKSQITPLDMDHLWTIPAISQVMETHTALQLVLLQMGIMPLVTQTSVHSNSTIV